MKTLKIKLEYQFKVPEGTEIVEDKLHGIFVVNKKHNINSKFMLEGFELELDERDENGDFIRSSMGYDGGKLSDFLYNQGEAMVESEDLKLGNKKLEYSVF
jgi:hypothetical protein